MNDFWIITTGILVAWSCSLLGCFLILRKMVMVGDAISHAILPGIVIAFLFSGSRNPIWMFIGAAGIGLLTTFLIEFFHKKTNLQNDASIGVTFTWLFALGIILISVFAGKIDLDQDCVLYGEIAYVPIDLWITPSGVVLGPRAIWIMGSVFILVLLFIIIGYKGLFLTTFDPAYAVAIGVSTQLWHYLLMSSVSLTTIAAFESVGAILVIALMIAPAAAAYLLTRDLKKMLMITAGIDVIIAIGGYYLAVFLNGSIAGAMSVVAGILFTIALLIYKTTNSFKLKDKKIAV